MFTSDRSFKLYSYSASHGLLLLRSGKDNIHSARLDVLFQDVRAVEIRAWFDGIEIREESPAWLAKFTSNPIKMIEPGNKVYLLKGNE